MTATDEELPLVECLRCGRPLRTPVSRARRTGEGCWRKLRRGARAAGAAVALPGMPAAGQTGPDLLVAAPEPAPVPVPAGPAATDQVWIAAPRCGIQAHRPATSGQTGCGRSTRTGLTLPAGQAADRYEACWCPRCWPAMAGVGR